MIENQVYKVVRRNGSRLHSCCHRYDLPPPMQLEYSPDFVTEPQWAGSRLFVFTDPEEAKRFCYETFACSHIELWSAIGYGELLPATPIHLAETISSCWEGKNWQKMMAIGDKLIVKGSYTVDKVKLIANVWYL